MKNDENSFLVLTGNFLKIQTDFDIYYFKVDIEKEKNEMMKLLDIEFFKDIYYNNIPSCTIDSVEGILIRELSPSGSEEILEEIFFDSFDENYMNKCIECITKKMNNNLSIVEQIIKNNNK